MGGESRGGCGTGHISAALAPSVGRAWSGAVQCVCCPNGPRPAASVALVTHAASSSADAGSAGRTSAAIAKPPGRASWRAAKRGQTSSSRGRSTWQETTAYRSADVAPIEGRG